VVLHTVREAVASSDVLPLPSPPASLPPSGNATQHTLSQKGIIIMTLHLEVQEEVRPCKDADCPISEREFARQLNSISGALLAGHQKGLRQKIFYYCYYYYCFGKGVVIF